MLEKFKGKFLCRRIHQDYLDIRGLDLLDETDPGSLTQYFEELAEYYDWYKFERDIRPNNKYKDGDLFLSGNGSWLLIEAKNMKEATLIFWKKEEELLQQLKAKTKEG